MLNQNQSSRSAALVAAGLCAPLLLGAGAASAQEAAAPAKTWQSSVALGATLTRGNSDSFLGTLSVESKRVWQRNELLLNAAFGYGENKVDGEYAKSQDYLRGSAQWNRLFSDRFYGGLRLTGEHDDIADLDYRLGASPMLGYYLIKNQNMSLAVEGGPSFIYERQGGDETFYVALRFAERFEWKISKTTRVWQTAEYLPEVDDWSNNYIINFEAGIDTKITQAWSLRLVAQDTYDNEPAAGREKNDFKLLAGIAYTF
jgi:putative salt-induced outer membrane protein YdiY